MSEFANADAVVYGVSRDSISSHQQFAEKYGLNMPLLSDPEGTICEAYAVLKEKTMYGKKSVGIERTTFIVNQNGEIAVIYPKVKVDGHAEEVLAAVKAI
jgi:thioredoxin-dependent peroxiredoxin